MSEPGWNKAGPRPARKRVGAMQCEERLAGIDVAKDTLEVALSDGASFSVSNDQAGIAELVGRLVPLTPKLVVLEASGGYERAAHVALGAAGIAVARINPRDAYHFAQANRRFAKTDRLDARGLMNFAAQMHPVATPPASAADQELRELVARRQQLVEMLAAESKRAQQTASGGIRRSIENVVRGLKQEKAAIERAIERRLRASAAKLVALLTSVPGVGPVVSSVLVARLPELGRVTARELAALVGVAPFVCQSGKWRGESHIIGGRADVRWALYMAAHNAIRRPGPLRDCYLRLRAAGKRHKQALVACIRKLAVMLNAMVRTQTAWRPSCPGAA